MNLFTRDYFFSTAGTKRQYAISSPITDGPFPDRYWLVRYLTVWVSDSAAEFLALYILSPAAYVQVTQQIATNGDAYKPDFSAPGAAGAPPIAGIHKLAPGNGGSSAANWLTQSVQGVGFGAKFDNTGYTDIIIPGGWALYCTELSATVSASARSIIMRLAYQEILNGCSPDAAW